MLTLCPHLLCELQTPCIVDWQGHSSVRHLLQEKGNAGAAVACLNELVTDALKHVPHCLAYMERVRDWHIFRFCAIPQACATQHSPAY